MYKFKRKLSRQAQSRRFCMTFRLLKETKTNVRCLNGQSFYFFKIKAHSARFRGIFCRGHNDQLVF